MSTQLVIDGSRGEGGGQILRTALSLSLVTGRPFRIEQVRAGRKRPGLMRQHLTAVEAARALSHAEVSGAAVGSQQLSFSPGKVRPGDYTFSVGTAGSATLVFQTVLPALVLAEGPSTLCLEGGTHNPLAPPFEFLARAFLPLLRRMGPDVNVTLERPGFYPAGGGRFRATIEPVPKLGALELLERGALRRQTARAVVAGIPKSIADRELRVVANRLGWTSSSLVCDELSAAFGPGNALMLELESEQVTELFTHFGERGVSAEKVAERACAEAASYLEAGVPVGPHLADQLLLPMALGAGGTFRTLEPTLHARTQAELLENFLGREVKLVHEGGRVWRAEVR